jgi:hypothetical protein
MILTLNMCYCCRFVFYDVNCKVFPITAKLIISPTASRRKGLNLYLYRSDSILSPCRLVISVFIYLAQSHFHTYSTTTTTNTHTHTLMLTSRISFIALIVIILSFTCSLCTCQTRSIDFDKKVTVKKAKLTQMSFSISSDEKITLDIINPNNEFSFKLSHKDTNPFSDAKAPRSDALRFFVFKLEDEEKQTDLLFNAVIRYIWKNNNVVKVPLNSMEFLLFRSKRWREFASATSVDVPTRTLTQGWSSSEYRPGGTNIAIFGGKKISLPEGDDTDLFNQFGEAIDVKANTPNSFKFQLSGNQEFDIEILGATDDFTMKVTNPLENPFPESKMLKDTHAVEFLSIDLGTSAPPDYNAVFRMDYGQLLEGDTSSLQFVIHRNGEWIQFSSDPDNNVKTHVITQGARSQDDLDSSTIHIALVGDSSVVAPAAVSISTSFESSSFTSGSFVDESSVTSESTFQVSESTITSEESSSDNNPEARDSSSSASELWNASSISFILVLVACVLFI